MQSSLSKKEKKQIDKFGNLVSWVLPIFNTKDDISVYQGTNGFGARINVQKQRGLRYSLAFPTNWAADKPGYYEVLIVPVLPTIAQEVADHLVFNISFKIEKLCRMYYAAGRTIMLKNFGPTLASPYDYQITHRYLRATIDKVDIVDERSGAVLASGKPNF